MTASVITEQCTRTLDDVVRPGRHHKGLLWCFLPLPVVHLDATGLWRKKNPELVGACVR